MIAASARVAADPSCEVVELLAFLVSGEEFCLPIMQVREIRTWSEPTPLPHSDAALAGDPPYAYSADTPQLNVVLSSFCAPTVSECVVVMPLVSNRSVIFAGRLSSGFRIETHSHSSRSLSFFSTRPSA